MKHLPIKHYVNSRNFDIQTSLWILKLARKHLNFSNDGLFRENADTEEVERFSQAMALAAKASNSYDSFEAAWEENPNELKPHNAHEWAGIVQKSVAECLVLNFNDLNIGCAYRILLESLKSSITKVFIEAEMVERTDSLHSPKQAQGTDSQGAQWTQLSPTKKVQAWFEQTRTDNVDAIRLAFFNFLAQLKHVGEEKAAKVIFRYLNLCQITAEQQSLDLSKFSVVVSQHLAKALCLNGMIIDQTGSNTTRNKVTEDVALAWMTSVLLESMIFQNQESFENHTKRSKEYKKRFKKQHAATLNELWVSEPIRHTYYDGLNKITKEEPKLKKKKSNDKPSKSDTPEQVSSQEKISKRASLQITGTDVKTLRAQFDALALEHSGENAPENSAKPILARSHKPHLSYTKSKDKLPQISRSSDKHVTLLEPEVEESSVSSNSEHDSSPTTSPSTSRKQFFRRTFSSPTLGRKKKK